MTHFQKSKKGLQSKGHPKTMRIAVRTAGKRHKFNVEETMNWTDFCDSVSTAVGIPVSKLSLISPISNSPLSGTPMSSLHEIGINSGDMLHCSSVPESTLFSSSTATKQTEPSTTSSSSTTTNILKSPPTDTKPKPAKKPKPTKKPKTAEHHTKSFFLAPTYLTSPVELPTTSSEPLGGTVVRRKMPDDNECLFRAIAFLLESDSKLARKTREIAAKCIAADPTRFSSVMLEKSNSEYVKWISKPESWGGAIELAIFAEYYVCEICAFDIRTGNMIRFGQNLPCGNRTFVLFDGIHYDALALSPLGRSDAHLDPHGEMDIRIFPRSQANIIASLKILTLQLQKQGHYTDTSSFSLHCTTCDTPLKGQKEAALHFKKTGHTSFREYAK